MTTSPETKLSPEKKPAPKDAKTASSPPPSAPKSSKRRFGRRHVKFGLAAILLLGIVNYGVLGTMKHDIDNNPDMSNVTVPTNGSVAVAVAAGLMDRELNVHSWTANDPWFAPAGLLDNMRNFQIGVVSAVGRFSFEMLDQIGRRSGSSSADPDLQAASGFLQFPPDIWIWEPSVSFLPGVPSESQFEQGLAALQSYNERLGAGEAVFERRADTLASALERISDNLGSQTSAIDEAQKTGVWIFSQTADDVFYENKGMLYAYDVILTALGDDFANVIAENNLGPIWEQTLTNLRQGSQLRPTVVLNGNLDKSIFANHLALQGFAMKRAIVQIEELARVLAI